MMRAVNCTKADGPLMEGSSAVSPGFATIWIGIFYRSVDTIQFINPIDICLRRVLKSDHGYDWGK
jgi:hypothetical protein